MGRASTTSPTTKSPSRTAWSASTSSRTWAARAAPVAAGTPAITRSLARADLNDDGVIDLVVGAPRASVDGLEVGAVYVVLGPLDGVRAPIESVAALTIHGSQALDWFGSSVTVSDINADGIGDLVVAADVEGGTGLAYTHRGPLSFDHVPVDPLDPYGASGPPVLSATDLETLITGVSQGAEIDAGRDLTGDDIGDIVFGAKNSRTSGEVFVIEGQGL